MKKIFLITQMVTLAVLLSACYTNVIEDDDTDHKGKEALIAVCPDPANPLLAALTTQNNTYYMYGKKDGMAYPTQLTGILVEQNRGGRCEVLFDSYWPIFLSTSDNVKFFLEWSSNTFASLTIVNATTGDQITTNIDLLRERSVLRSKSEASFGTISVKLSLKNHGLPEDAYCCIDVMGVDGRFLTRCKGEKISEGVYEVQIPKSFVFDNEDQYYTPESCMAVTELSGEILSISSEICSEMEKKVTNMNSNGNVASVVVSSARLLRTVFDECSEYIEYIRSNNDNIPFYDLYRKVESYNSSTVRLLPCVYAIPYDIAGTPFEVDLAQGYIDPIEISW